jgi:hypothetical protein
MDQKWFLQSKTIIGVLIMLLVQLAPLLGFQFTNEDGEQVIKHLDAILTAIGALLAIWGRWTASEPLTAFKSKRTLNSPWPVMVAALLLLAACATPPLDPKLSFQTQFYQLKSSYTIVKEEAAQYAALPFCTETVVVGCAQPEIVVKLNDAVKLADLRIRMAEPFVFVVDPGEVVTTAEQEDVLYAATVALRQVTAILALTAAQQGA